jgi:hypothetical protein
MAITVKSLAKGTLGTSEGNVYTTPVNKTTIVSSIRLVNTGTGTAVVNLLIRRGNSGTTYRIAPKDLSLPPNAAYMDDAEVTLEGGATAGTTDDQIRGISTTSGVDFVLSGIERD